MTVLITRPEVDSGSVVAELKAMGHEVLAMPLVEIIECKTKSIDLEGTAAILVTSKNGVRALSRATSSRDLSLYVVGPGTAAEASMAGYSNIIVGPGDAQGMARMLRQRLSPSDGRLIYASGLHVASDLSRDLSAVGYDIRRVILYEAREKKELPELINDELRNNRIASVVFFSSRIASIFVTLVEDAGLDRTLLNAEAICMSD